MLVSPRSLPQGNAASACNPGGWQLRECLGPGAGGYETFGAVLGVGGKRFGWALWLLRRGHPTTPSSAALGVGYVVAKCLWELQERNGLGPLSYGIAGGDFRAYETQVRQMRAIAPLRCRRGSTAPHSPAADRLGHEQHSPLGKPNSRTGRLALQFLGVALQ